MGGVFGSGYGPAMSDAAISLEVLPAGYGDSLLISCPVRGGVWRMLVDTGPDECWPLLKTRLASIAPDASGNRVIDLAVISHIDHDHIGGAGQLFSDRSLGLRFGDVWFNAPPRKATRGVAEGQSLAELLGAVEVDLPWNEVAGGQPLATPADGSFLELPAVGDEPRLTLLSPSPKQLSKLFTRWDKELARLRRKETEEALPAPATKRGAGGLDLKALAARRTPTDRAPANGSSIALLLEHRGASVLLAADAFSSVLVSALKALAHHRQQPDGLKIDAVKLSHHGSRGNVTNDLLKAVRADHYIISTNGAMFNHPDDEAIARVILHGGPKPTLWFNYGNDRNRRWDDEDLRRQHDYVVVLPGSGSSGVSLQLGSQHGTRRTRGA
jgi:beta-lactamase superfamily II metal-dependent hydrolase